MHNLLRSRAQSEFSRLQNEARRAGQRLDFGNMSLRVVILGALGSACEYCTELFGVDEFGVVYDVPPDGRHGQPASRGLANVRVCCDRCAGAKGWLSGSEWRDVMAALRASDEVAARTVLASLAFGNTELRRMARRKGTSPGGSPASNARGGVVL